MTKKKKKYSIFSNPEDDNHYNPFRAALFCENVDCEHISDSTEELKKLTIYKVKLTEDFEGKTCYWCNDCVTRYHIMIESIEPIKPPKIISPKATMEHPLR